MNFTTIKPGITIGQNEIEVHKTDKKFPQYIYLIAGIHGNEVEGIYVVQKLMAKLENFDELEIPLVIIPILNIDGHLAGISVNSRNIDLNRNLPSKNWNKSEEHSGKTPLSEPETKFLVKALTKYPPRIIISFHTRKAELNYYGQCQSIANSFSIFNHYPIVNKNPLEGSLASYATDMEIPLVTYNLPPLSSGVSLKEIWHDNEVALTTILTTTLVDSP